MNDHYTYFIILILALAGPVLLSFDKKVAFFSKLRYVLPAMILPAVFFIAWDILFVRAGVWSFNESYITGVKLVNIPIEEAIFFFVVPYCCLFIYECIRCYFPSLKNNFTSLTITQILAVALLIFAIIYNKRAYSFYTFLFDGLLLLIVVSFKKSFHNFYAIPFLVSYALILLPFLCVNGLLTSLPVVLYNNSENSGVRIFTIPFEDIFYGMLLVLMNIIIFERLRETKTVKKHNKN